MAPLTRGDLAKIIENRRNQAPHFVLDYLLRKEKVYMPGSRKRTRQLRKLLNLAKGKDYYHWDFKDSRKSSYTDHYSVEKLEEALLRKHRDEIMAPWEKLQSPRGPMVYIRKNMEQMVVCSPIYRKHRPPDGGNLYDPGYLRRRGGTSFLWRVQSEGQFLEEPRKVTWNPEPPLRIFFQLNLQAGERALKTFLKVLDAVAQEDPSCPHCGRVHPR